MIGRKSGLLVRQLDSNTAQDTKGSDEDFRSSLLPGVTGRAFTVHVTFKESLRMPAEPVCGQHMLHFIPRPPCNGDRLGSPAGGPGCGLRVCRAALGAGLALFQARLSPAQAWSVCTSAQGRAWNPLKPVQAALWLCMSLALGLPVGFDSLALGLSRALSLSGNPLSASEASGRALAGGGGGF